jgi:Rne/Rng family ribonuclease
MTKEMIISSSAHETRVAILEEDQVAEIFIERERQRGVVGNLYKGRVSKVLPGMQSAFVDLGLERDGFLYVSDVIASTEEFDRLETE